MNWVKHEGSRRPVARNEVVEIRNAEGESQRGLADEFNWGIDIEPEGRIAEYRVLRPVSAEAHRD